MLARIDKSYEFVLHIRTKYRMRAHTYVLINLPMSFVLSQLWD